MNRKSEESWESNQAKFYQTNLANVEIKQIIVRNPKGHYLSSKIIIFVLFPSLFLFLLSVEGDTCQ